MGGGNYAGSITITGGAILRYSQAGRPINPQWVRELSLAAYLAGQEKFRPVPQPSAN